MIYYVTSKIHLSLESYHNAGLPPKKTKEIIERVLVEQIPGSGYCQPSGINDNLTIHTVETNPNTIQVIVNVVGMALDRALKEVKE